MSSSTTPASSRPVAAGGARRRSRRSTSRARGNWTGFLARSTVVDVQHRQRHRGRHADSILDFAEPEWAGRVGFSPTGADFQAIVSAVLELEGEEATRTWLEGLAENGIVYDEQPRGHASRSTRARSTPASPTTTTGTATRRRRGADSDSSELYFFGDQDPGAFVSVSGAGILAEQRARRRPPRSSSTS